jgi:multidrug resistance efflux pump
MTVQYVIDGAVGVPEEELAVHIGDTLFVIDRARYVLAFADARERVANERAQLAEAEHEDRRNINLADLASTESREQSSSRGSEPRPRQRQTVVEHESGGSAELYPTLAAGAVAA